MARFHGSQFLMMAAALVIVVAGLRAIKTIALPFVIAILLSVLNAPLVAWLMRHRVPRALSVIAAVLTNIAVLLTMVLVVGGSIAAFTNSLPDYQQRIEREIREGMEWLDERGFVLDTGELYWLRELLEEIGEESPETAEEPASALPDEPEPEDGDPLPEPSPIDIRGLVNVAINGLLAFAGTTLRGVAELTAMTLLIFIMMVFLLFEASGLPRKLELAFGWERSDLYRMAKARQEIQRYLGIKTLVSLTTGVLIGSWVWLLGLDFPELWGLIALMLNYIPNIGSLAASIPAVLLALIDMGPGSALLVALGYTVVNLTLGNFVEPHLLGRRLGISTLVVFLSLVFWGWVWGPIGMLLAVPITMILKIVLENTEDLRWVAHLISANPAAGPQSGV